MRLFYILCKIIYCNDRSYLPYRGIILDMIKIHYLQHIQYEGLGSIADWINENAYDLSVTQLFNGQSLPCIKTRRENSYYNMRLESRLQNILSRCRPQDSFYEVFIKRFAVKI